MNKESLYLGIDDKVEALDNSNFHTFNATTTSRFQKILEDLQDGKIDKDIADKFYKHQQFLYYYAKALNSSGQENSKTRGLLLYHRLGSGKTISAIAIAEACRYYQFNTKVVDDIYKSNLKKSYKRKIIIMLPANLQYDPWIKEITHFYAKDDSIIKAYNKLNQNDKENLKSKAVEKLLLEHDIYFIKYNAFAKNAWVSQKNKIPSRASESLYKYYFDYSEDSNPFNDAILIVDEIHNLLNTIRNEENKTSGEYNFTKLYRDIINAQNLKMFALSGTPVMNHPSELSYLFNMLRGNIGANYRFKLSEKDFDNTFFTQDIDGNIILKNEEMFMRRINGLVSYYQGYDDSMFAEAVIDDVMVGFQSYQSDIYQKIRRVEWLKNQDFNIIGDESSDYSTQSSMSMKVSNVVLPKEVFSDKDLYYNKQKIKYRKLKNYTYSEKSGQTINIPGVLSTKENLEDATKEIIKVLRNDNQPLKMNNELANISIKMYHVLKRIKESNGPVIVYSQYEGIYGITMMTEVLMQNGFLNADSIYANKTKDKYKKTVMDNLTKQIASHKTAKTSFMVWTGKSRNLTLKNIFNDKRNKNGEIIKVFLMTKAGKEGISLKNVRQIHLLEPWWNNVITDQVIGRGIRITSHEDLTDNDFIDTRIDVSNRVNGKKLVNVFKYYAFYDTRLDIINNVGGEQEWDKMKTYKKIIEFKKAQVEAKRISIDYNIKTVADRKTTKTNLILSLLKRNAVDCQLNLNFKDYDCFNQNKIIEYFSAWNVEDHELSEYNSISELKMIHHGDKVYWMDKAYNIYDRKESLDKFLVNNASFDEYYSKIGTMDIATGIIDFIQPEKTILEEKPVVSQKNYIEIVLEDTIKDTGVVYIGNIKEAKYITSLEPREFYSLLPSENELSVLDFMSNIYSQNKISKYFVSEKLNIEQLFKTIYQDDKVVVDTFIFDINYIFTPAMNEFAMLLFKYMQADILGNIDIIFTNLYKAETDTYATINNSTIFNFDIIKKNAINIDGDIHSIISIEPKTIKEYTKDIFNFFEAYYGDITSNLVLVINSVLNHPILKNDSSYDVNDFVTNVVKKNQLLTWAPELDYEIYLRIMAAHDIEIVNIDNIQIPVLEDEYEIIEFVNDIVERLNNSQNETLRDIFDTYSEDIIQKLINHDILGKADLIKEYNSSTNKRLQNIEFTTDDFYNSNIINTLMVYADIRSMRVIDIKSTREYIELPATEQKASLNKDELCDLIIKYYGI